MIKSGITRALVLTAATAVIATGANAISLVAPSGVLSLPGQTSASLPTLTGGTLLASNTSLFSTPKWSGYLYTTVIKETTGKLSFLYQIHIDPAGPSTDHIARTSTIDYTGFLADADYISDGFTGFGFVAPVGVNPFPHTADRQTDDVIGFHFNNGPADPGLAHGETSNIYYVRTNAMNYTWGSSFVIDGAVATVDSFAPTAVPSPAALLPFGVGLVTAFVRRRRN